MEKRFKGYCVKCEDWTIHLHSEETTLTCTLCENILTLDALKSLDEPDKLYIYEEETLPQNVGVIGSGGHMGITEAMALSMHHMHPEILEYNPIADLPSEKSNYGITNSSLLKGAGIERTDLELLRSGHKRKHDKVGRNHKCPCGSGLKYKRCCL